MQRLADMALVVLQWTLVVLGAVIVLVTLYASHLVFLPITASSAQSAETYYVVLHLRWVLLGITSGTIAMGLGAALFYLRRSDLARRGS